MVALAGPPQSFWRKEDPVLSDEGAVTMGGMFGHQRRWWEADNFIKVLVGGYGAGKTLIGSKRIISLALQNAPCPVAVVSPSYPIARKTVIATIKDLLAGKKSIYGRKLWWSYNQSFHQFTIKFKGRTGTIHVLSGDKPMSLRGPNLAAAYIDEPFIQERDVFDQMIARVRHPQATDLEICMTGTPEQLNWGFDICEGDEADAHDLGLVNASSADNRTLPAQYVGRLKAALSEKAVKAYVDGLFVNLAAGQVYYGFDRFTNVQDLEMPNHAELGCGMDFNVNPMAATVFWRSGSHMHFFDELELENADTEYMADILTERYGSRLREIFPDATGNARKTSAPGGKSDFWYLRKAGYTVRAPWENPKRRDRYNAVNGKLDPEKGSATITISPKCKKLIKYLSVHSHELMKKQDYMTHLLDAMGYPVAYLFPVDRTAIGATKLRGA